MKCSHPLNYKPSLVDTGIRTLFLRCTDGCFTDKLEPTYILAARFRLELKIADSNSAVLPITLSGFEQHERFEHSPPIWKTGAQPSMHMLHIFLSGSYENRTHSNRSTICDVSRYTNEPCNLYGSRTHISRMKILCPEPLDEQVNNRGPQGNRTLHKSIANAFRQPWNMAAQSCIGDRIRTCSLFIPGEVSGQSECSYIFK